MNEHVLIIGSGPAAVGAAMAGIRHPGTRLTVLDIGGRLEEAKRATVARVASQDPSAWSSDDLESIAQNPVRATARGLPQKRSYGSDFPFRNFGQRTAFEVSAAVNEELVSGAYGGFSNVWGAQAMPFSAASFRDWPVSAAQMQGHYEKILETIPFAGEHDDLERFFPLHAAEAALPALSARSDAVLRRYARSRTALNARGVFVGRARLALNAAACIRCGLCLTGCPHSLIYSAAQTMEQMRRNDLVYHGGLLATRIEETSEGVTVTARDLATEQLHEFRADRVFVACGAIGTSRIVLGSLDRYGAIPVKESAQFILPFASRRPVADPRGMPDFTLNQFNIVVTLDDECLEASQLHMYTYNSAFLEALPGLLSHSLLSPARTAALRRLSIAFGYLPSWESPGFTIQARPAAPGMLPALRVTERSGRQSALANAMLRSVLARLSRAARALDLWPLLPALRLSAPGKSYHFGGTFAHARKAAGPLTSDALGRVAPWTRVHLVDASVFPTIPATTFTLTVMANAHRIAQTALRELT